MIHQKEKKEDKNLFRAIFDFKREELPVAFLMFLFFFLVIAVFQILRPLKKGLFVETYGADVELNAKLLNIVVAALGVVVFTFLYNRIPRQRVIYIFCLFFAAAFTAMRFLLIDPGAWSIWGFYVIVDLITTLMVASFWAFLTDISNPEQAKRLYGLVGAGGVIGGVVGVAAAKLSLEKLNQGGLLMLSAVLMVGVLFIVLGVESLVRQGVGFRRSAGVKTSGEESSKKRSKFAETIEGAKLALRSKYLAAIVGIMASYEIASQIINYQYSKFSEVLPGVAATQSFYIDVQLISNILSVVVQLFLVSLIMKRLGLSVALCVLPVAALISSGLFIAVPGLIAAGLLFVSDNGLNYSIQQTARESLYTVTSSAEKYKARAFTNMFVQRAAKGVAIFGLKGMMVIGFTIRSVGMVAMVVLIAMALLGIYNGKRFAEKTGKEPLTK